jgi:hypothetical protein
MRESRTYGSGRGARGNSRPYRENADVLRRSMVPNGTSRQAAGASNFRSLLRGCGRGKRQEAAPEPTLMTLGDPRQVDFAVLHNAPRDVVG